MFLLVTPANASIFRLMENRDTIATAIAASALASRLPTAHVADTHTK